MIDITTIFGFLNTYISTPIELVLLGFVCWIKFNDLKHIEARHFLEDSKEVHESKMTKETFFRLHKNKEPLKL